MARIRIVTGHYGSGKTEFAVNLALRQAEAWRPLTLVDLDIVNPYFRSAERRELLETHGVSVLACSCNGIADIPAVPAAIAGIWEDAARHAILDIGGDAIGAHVLARFSDKLKSIPHELWCVINANRPETDTPEKAVQYLRQIEKSAELPVTGIINNTHLCRQTTVSDPMRGAALTHAVSAMTCIPVVWHVVEERLVPEFDAKGEGAVLPIRITMTKPWEIWEDADGRTGNI